MKLDCFQCFIRDEAEEKDINTRESDEIANKEVNKMMSRVSEEVNQGQEVPEALNQEAVDKLPAEMGF